MNANWTISAEALKKWEHLVKQNKDKPLAARRRARNVRRRESLDLSNENIWRVLVGCNVTTQQRSGPNSAVSKFLQSDSPALDLARCKRSRNVQDLIEKECAEARLRRSTIIGGYLAQTLDNLENQRGWEELQTQLASLQKDTTPQVERAIAAYLSSGKFPGLGLKQSRNFLQSIGLSRYEVPLDSRVLKRLREFGANFVPSGSAMVDEAVYLFVQDLVQRIAKELGIYPCELDACIFDSFGGEESRMKGKAADAE